MFWVEFKDYEATVEWPVNSVRFLLQTFTPVLCTFSKDVSQALLSLQYCSVRCRGVSAE